MNVGVLHAKMFMALFFLKKLVQSQTNKLIIIPVMGEETGFGTFFELSLLDVFPVSLHKYVIQSSVWFMFWMIKKFFNSL